MKILLSLFGSLLFTLVATSCTTIIYPHTLPQAQQLLYFLTSTSFPPPSLKDVNSFIIPVLAIISLFLSVLPVLPLFLANTYSSCFPEPPAIIENVSQFNFTSFLKNVFLITESNKKIKMGHSMGVKL